MEKKTVSELKFLAKIRGYTGYSTLKKPELIYFLSSKGVKVSDVKSPVKRPKVTKKKYSHPTYEIMITTAINALKQRGGSSRQAIKKYLEANYKLSPNWETIFKTQIKRLVEKGKLIQIKQSFKIAK